MSLEIYQFPCRSDNYGVLVHESESGKTLCVDTPEARPILAALAEKGWTLSTILITHHHGDHTEGNSELKRITGATIIGPKSESSRIADLDELVSEGDVIDFAGHPINVIETPGHTSGPVSYHFPEDNLLFAGDTLFALGCGRLFEGTPADMWNSLSKLVALGDNTKVYCGHEYTLSNAEFSLTIEPGNIDLQTRYAEIKDLRAKNQPTLPTTIGLERKTNPFLRPNSSEIRENLDMHSASDLDVFTKIRSLKDKA